MASSTLLGGLTDASIIAGRHEIDIVSVRGLQLPAGVIFADIWTEPKAQPAFVDIELRLGHGLRSAASQDSLNSSTVHYGILSKQVRASLSTAQNMRSTLDSINGTIYHVSSSDDDSDSAASESCVTIVMPKASCFGESCSLSVYQQYDSSFERLVDTSCRLTFDNLKIMTLIGVNANERTATQALVVTSAFVLDPKERHLMDAALNVLSSYERRLVEHVHATSFETLEALAQHLFERIAYDLHDYMAVSALQLRLEKPSAVIWADAPAIEILRRVRH